MDRAPHQEIDVSVRRLIAARFKLGMFDSANHVAYAQIPISQNDTPDHSELARKVAQESIVLLKNEAQTLPLSKNLKSIAVVGPYADNVDVLMGNYNGIPSHPVTVLQGIRNKLGPNVEINFVSGVEPIEQAALFRDIPAQCLHAPPDHPGNGLFGEYFDNGLLKGSPLVIRFDTTTRFYWGLDSPAVGIPADHFSVRWTGRLTIPTSGTYRFGLRTDDRGRFFLNGKLTIDNWEPYEVNAMKKCELQLEKGKEYDFKLEYAEETEYAGIALQWMKLEQTSENDRSIKDATRIAKRSDVVIVVAGISPQLEGEEMSVELPGFHGGDRTSLDLPAYEEKLIQALYATGKPIVVVLTNGSALAVNWETAHVGAIVDVWYPGQEGGDAVADVLFGDYNPAGRLPMTFYKSVDDLPPFENYVMKGRTYRYFESQPLYPFGYGLSYTQIEYKNVAVNDSVAGPQDTVHVHVTLTNVGKFDGDEVVQLYVRAINAAPGDALKSLKGFKRTYLPKGSSTTVELPLCANDLRSFEERKGDFVITPGTYEVQIGSSSSDIKLLTRIQIRP